MTTGQMMTGQMTTDVENFRKIMRRTKCVDIHSGKVRERNMCPNCNSLDVRKRVITKDYRCYNCDWIGNKTCKIMA